jgi:hypothetical protein
MIEDEITVVIFTGNTYCEGRGRIEKLYLTNRVGYKLRVGFIDTAIDADADAAGSAGFIDIDESVCLYVVVAVTVLSTCLGVLDAEGSVCLGVLDAEGSVCLGVLDAEGSVCLGVLDAEGSVCLGVLDAEGSVCLGVLDAEGSVLLGVLVAEDVPVAVLVSVLDVVAVSDVVVVTSACLGVLDANVCLGVAVEDSMGLVKVGIEFCDAFTVLVIEY